LENDNGWFFTQAGSGYCAFRIAGDGGYTVDASPYSNGYIVTFNDMWAPAVVQMGKAGDYMESFTQFKDAVKANSFAYSSGKLAYTSLAGDTYEYWSNSTTVGKINGSTVDLNPAKTYDFPNLSMLYGEDTATISYGAHSDLVLDFSGPVETGIEVLDTGFAVTMSDGSPGDFTYIAAGGGTRAGVYSKNFNAGATSDMLVVAVSVEKSTEAYTVSYAGTPMTQAVQSSGGSGVSIWYLANPSASGTIAVDFTAIATVNGFGIGIASLNNADGAIVLHSVGSDSPTNSVDITTTVADTFVMVAGDANANGAPVSMDSPLTTIGTDTDVGSSQVCFGYENEVAADSHTYSWTPDVAARGIAAAAFAPAAPPTLGTLFFCH
ncbi:hypothetical protein ACFL34_01915, partial [Candidatus Sumerlaeota bacterium]